MSPSFEDGTYAIPNMLDSAATNRGRFRNGTVYRMMIIPPENRPAEPKPAIALPTMSVDEFCARAQMRDPT
jgi:hypothetical protein